MNPRSFGRAGLVGLSALLFVACRPPDVVEIETERAIRADSELVMPTATSEDRFGDPRSGPGYTVPEGWQTLEPEGIRSVNLLAGEMTECYVIPLAGEAGGVLSNLNRWRGEVGLEPLDAAAVEALEKVTMLGKSCPLLDVEGNYQGMGGNEGVRRVLATLRVRPTGSIFVKMVGPPEEVAAHREGFIAFVTSLEGM